MATRFQGCVLDRDARTLVREGVHVHLTPKAFDVLVLLVAERPRAVKKAEILDRVWPGTFVTDASLARTIHEIRDALDDHASSIIRTVHGHGYAFAAEAVESGPNADSSKAGAGSAANRAWLHVGPHTVPLSDGKVLIGRDPAVAIPLTSPKASWHHARLTVTGQRVTIEDLGSKNGTMVCGHRLRSPTELRDGDDILVGTTRLVFRTGVKAAETATDR